ncbi:hypothetical protein APS_0676 [Acetobacter pasteurianus subsp. pasteurianus LMG 1262 = NBRC 106471]|nr:hypothetical protein APS_0676 [Acetobacter pasteurianus subsp. pasteurianus LMG 1262 = NBRC 106471]
MIWESARMLLLLYREKDKKYHHVFILTQQHDGIFLIN